VIARVPIAGRGFCDRPDLGELAYKAARAGLCLGRHAERTLDAGGDIAQRTGIVLVGRAVSGTPHVHRPDE